MKRSTHTTQYCQRSQKANQLLMSGLGTVTYKLKEDVLLSIAGISVVDISTSV